MYNIYTWSIKILTSLRFDRTKIRHGNKEKQKINELNQTKLFHAEKPSGHNGCSERLLGVRI